MTPETPTAPAEPTTDPATTGETVVEDLIEEVSIDGMCGVY